jgi:hypothetical protein
MEYYSYNSSLFPIGDSFIEFFPLKMIDYLDGVPKLKYRFKAEIPSTQFACLESSFIALTA